MKNKMKMEIKACSENENFARNSIAAFTLGLNPSLSELSDIKTAVSEAVTNCIVHAYKEKKGMDNKIDIECETDGNHDGGEIHICIRDFGCGIKDVEKALQPFYTTLSDDERSGMGFTIMQTFMDKFNIESEEGIGTKVYMSKTIGKTGEVNA